MLLLLTRKFILACSFIFGIFNSSSFSEYLSRSSSCIKDIESRSWSQKSVFVSPREALHFECFDVERSLGRRYSFAMSKLRSCYIHTDILLKSVNTAQSSNTEQTDRRRRHTGQTEQTNRETKNNNGCNAKINKLSQLMYSCLTVLLLLQYTELKLKRLYQNTRFISQGQGRGHRSK